MPHCRAGAFKVARFALVKQVLQFGWFDCSKESIQVRRVEVLLHNNLL